jgi:hypothetical protein
MTGGCLCGRVRYEVEVEDDDAYLCHCGMCRKATGGVAEAFKSVKRDGLTWLREPDWYDSSDIARRPYCAQCGSPLGWMSRDDAETFDLTVGSFDDPSSLRPTKHIWTETMLPAWLDTGHLPKRGAGPEQSSEGPA